MSVSILGYSGGVKFEMLSQNDVGMLSVDANECDMVGPHNDCAQRCISKQPGYICDCDPGYRLAADGKNCTGSTYRKSPMC